MGKIQEYPAITTPAANDLLFIGDTSTSNQIHNITVANLHKVKQVWALDTDGLKLTDRVASDKLGVFIKEGGNVGIGQNATSPNTFLELNSGARTGAFNAGSGTTWIDMLLLNPTDTLNAAVGINFQVDNAFGASSGAGIAGIKSHATNAQMDLAFVVDPVGGGSSEAMRILSDGKVGINTVAPATQLEVWGDAQYIGSNTENTNSYSGIRFAENGTAKAYIQYVGANFATTGRQSTLELRAAAGIAFFADNTSDADVFLRSNGQVGIGPDQWTADANLPQAVLHVKGTGVVADGDEPLLRVEATSNNAAICLKSFGTARPGYIISTYNNLYIGASVVPAAHTHLQISKSTGRLIVGGPYADFTYPLTVGSIWDSDAPVVPGTEIWLKPTVARFIGYNATEHGTIDGKTFLVLTNPVAQPQLGIVYQSAGGSPPGAVQWLSGSFYGPNDVNYFGWRYLGTANINDPDRATFYSSILQNNTVYISSDDTVSADIAECTGGINAANTAAAFGSVNGNGTTSPVVTAAYNATVAVSAAVATITFTKELSNTAYTVIANGWNVTDDEVMFGEVTARTAGSAGPPIVPPTCQITFRGTTVPNLQTVDVRWTFVVYGAKFKE